MNIYSDSLFMIMALETDSKCDSTINIEIFRSIKIQFYIHKANIFTYIKLLWIYCIIWWISIKTLCFIKITFVRNLSFSENPVLIIKNSQTNVAEYALTGSTELTTGKGSAKELTSGMGLAKVLTSVSDRWKLESRKKSIHFRSIGRLTVSSRVSRFWIV